MNPAVEVKAIPRTKVFGTRSALAALLVAGAMVGGIAIGRSTVRVPQAAVVQSLPTWAQAAEQGGFSGRLGFSAVGEAVTPDWMGSAIEGGYTGQLGFSTASSSWADQAQKAGYTGRAGFSAPGSSDWKGAAQNAGFTGRLGA